MIGGDYRKLCSGRAALCVLSGNVRVKPLVHGRESIPVLFLALQKHGDHLVGRHDTTSRLCEEITRPAWGSLPACSWNLNQASIEANESGTSALASCYRSRPTRTDALWRPPTPHARGAAWTGARLSRPLKEADATAWAPATASLHGLLGLTESTNPTTRLNRVGRKANPTPAAGRAAELPKALLKRKKLALIGELLIDALQEAQSSHGRVGGHAKTLLSDPCGP